MIKYKKWGLNHLKLKCYKSVGEILISKFAEQRIRIKKMISENLKQYEMVQQE